ncbi:hypothetical protein [Xanthocytophaga flava]|uniref:hypothetical protein n=1 Tax=Xanthocytophaga flava TaxID=3048013 RepID=UPI0028D392F9|nr:hypothetical protein [Xanthocytophaga flavus]MDJ1469717.1 hypothetical protein [Xanthocytophaga flavus]
MQKSIIEKHYKMPLGIIKCGLNSQKDIKLVETKSYRNGKSEMFKTSEHKIEIIEFKIPLPLYNGEMITDSLAWIFRIEKISAINELLETYCLLDIISNNIKFDVTTGQNLNAIEASNNEWILHIGTEDGEMLNLRAQDNNWFPQRLESNLELYQKMTETRKNGFMTKIPDLQEGEKIHIQYLTAYDKKEIDNVNTWLAVDEEKRNLEKWIGLE